LEVTAGLEASLFRGKLVDAKSLMASGTGVAGQSVRRVDKEWTNFWEPIIS
jgi:hypothetical protein